MKYDLKGHVRSSKSFFVYLFSSNDSNASPNCVRANQPDFH